MRGACDFAAPCNVTLTFTRGQRYCTVEDVKTGNAEVLSACHRLRSREVAMQPKTARGAIELQDMLVFLVQGEPGSKSKHAISILVDSPGASDRRREARMGTIERRVRQRGDSARRCCPLRQQRRSLGRSRWPPLRSFAPVAGRGVSSGRLRR